MVVLSVSSRFRAAIFSLLLSIPLIALEIKIFTRSSWGHLPYATIFYWCLAVSLICLPVMNWLYSMRRWALWVVTLLFVAWLGVSFSLTLKVQDPSLGFFSLVLLGYGYFQLSWIKSEMNRSYMNPRISWFEQLPKPIPEVHSSVEKDEIKTVFQVSRIDEEGAFVFSTKIPYFFSKNKMFFKFQFRNRTVQFTAIPTVAIAGGKGAGILFCDLTDDLKKDLSDFLEVLRGEGHV